MYTNFYLVRLWMLALAIAGGVDVVELELKVAWIGEAPTQA